MVMVWVSATDIEEGEVGSCSACPVARAVCRWTGTRRVWVRMDTVRVGRTVYRTPRSVRRFIKKFDGGDPVAPFGFRLAA